MSHHQANGGASANTADLMSLHITKTILPLSCSGLELWMTFPQVAQRRTFGSVTKLHGMRSWTTRRNFKKITWNHEALYCNKIAYEVLTGQSQQSESHQLIQVDQEGDNEQDEVMHADSY
jgi:hypothetical protein